MGRRGNIRFYVSLAMEFQVLGPDSKISWESRAILKNISQGGLYFECETVPQLRCGNEAEFTVITPPAKYSIINSPIKGRAVVKRIEPRVAGSGNFGVALQFLSDPLSG